jgi:hypothetical protein
LFPNSVHTESSKAIQQLLTVAEQDYVRYFDLFSSVYYLNNQNKRIQAAKRYSLLKACEALIQSQTHTTKEIFEIYKNFESSSIKHYNSFLRKIKEFRELGYTSCTHGRIGQKYEYKINPYINTLIFQLLCDPHKYSYTQVTEWVNLKILQFNQTKNTSFKTISRSSIAYKYVENKNEINLYRNGISQFNTETRPYLPRIAALNAGSLVQMDGTPVQIFCWNHPSQWKKDKKRLIRLNLFVLRDAYSGKITGFDLSESEDRFNVIEALKLHVRLHGHLPAELVHDNFSATKTDEFKDLRQKLTDKGVIVRAAKVGNAQDKGEIERYFGTFQSRFQRLIDGYLGEGIKSRRKNGRISEEFIKKHTKENGHYGYDEMQKIIVELIAMYNNSCISDKYGKTPNELYSESEKPYVKTVDVLDFAKIFWFTKCLKVNRSLIVNEVRKLKYIYEIWKDEHKLLLNGKQVRVYYELDDASEIHVFTLEGEFVCTCKQKVQVHEAAVDRQEGEELTIIKHEAHNNTLKQHIDQKARKRIELAEEYTQTDYEAVIPYTMEKMKLNHAESQTLINTYFNSKGLNTGDIKEYEPISPDTPYHNSETSNNNKKGKGIFTVNATYEEA